MVLQIAFTLACDDIGESRDHKFIQLNIPL